MSLRLTIWFGAAESLSWRPYGVTFTLRIRSFQMLPLSPRLISAANVPARRNTILACQRVAQARLRV
jgi:hypothetical protein